MQDRYWLYARSNGIYYIQDQVTGRQESLRTKNASEARRVLAAKNQAFEQPSLNITMAKAYLTSKSPDMLNRTWEDVMKEMAAGYSASGSPTLERWDRVTRSAPFKILHYLPLLHTESSHFLDVLRHLKAGVSTNYWLRIMHNRALDLGWILSPVLSRRAWPKLVNKPKRAITWDEHQKLLTTEWNSEWKLYYEMLWETGGSQTDIASLSHKNIDMARKRIVYQRAKMKGKTTDCAVLVVGEKLENLLSLLPQFGYLFPELRTILERQRSSRFRKRCKSLGIAGVTLHSYRYAWAERAQSVGMPMREAMAHLGHRSRAVHLAYSEKAEVVTLPLEYYEKQWNEKILQFTPPQIKENHA